MLEVEQFKQVADEVFRHSGADETEVVLVATDSALTRFASSAIHQNVVERDAELRVRAVFGRRAGVATTNDLSSDALERVVARAAAVARAQPESPDFAPLPVPTPIAAVDGYDATTADCSPNRRAGMVKVVCDLAVGSGLAASGALTTESTTLGVANTGGVFALERTSRANFLTVVMDADGGSGGAGSGGGGSGYAEQTSRDVDAIDPEALGREAVDVALRSRDPVRVEPGEYPVVLGEYAVGELLSYLAYMGFGALALQEGTSFMRGKLGQRIVDEWISIWDDGHDPRGLPSAFDYEGVAKQRVPLIERGVAAGVVYDTRTAARDGRASTGHGLPAPNTFGPFPSHLVMAAGDTPRDELARGIERGLWVSRLHYVNVLQQDRAILTGLTRDGTFLIERGELTRPVKNLRFTQSVTDAWDGLGALGRDLKLVDNWGGGSLVPAMRLDRFAFTGVSDES